LVRNINKAKVYKEASLRFPHFFPVGQKTWSLWEILVSVLKLKKSSPLKLENNELLLCRNNINRGHSIDASYQVLVHLANQFQRRRFLEMDQLETRIAYGGLFVNASERNEQYS
jgi:hypothetical protein